MIIPPRNGKDSQELYTDKAGKHSRITSGLHPPIQSNQACCQVTH